jgi:CubicO group peptidase (beta-lactamase class C family)
MRLWLGPGLAVLLAASPALVVEGMLARRLDRHLSRLTPFGFAGTVLVARGDEVLLHRGYGWADPVARVPETTETLHAIGSLTKQFTAAAVLRLETDGRLRVSDRLGDLLAGVPPDKAAITLHQLLTHTAGIVEMTYGSGLEAEWAPRTRGEVVAEILARPLLFPPGDGFAYSNAGYTLLAAVVEQVSGQPFDLFLRRRLLAPLGIEGIGMQVPGWDRARFPTVMAGDQDRGSLWGRLGLDREAPPPRWYLTGNSGLQATAHDVFRWVRALRGGRVVPATALARMFDGGRHAYGYGWEVTAVPGGTRVFHHLGGHYVGTNAEIRVEEATDTTVLVLCDRLVDRRVTWTTALRPALLAILAGTEPRSAPPQVRDAVPGELEAWAGTWGDHRGAAFVAEAHAGRLRVRPLRDDVTAALVGPSLEALEAQGAQAAQLVERLLRGERSDPALAQVLGEVATAAGAHPRVAAGPTVPDVGDAFVTTTRVEGAAGDARVHLRWKDGAVVAVHRSPLLVEVPFLPDARRPGVLAGHHPFLGTSPELLLVENRRGPISLRLGGRGFRRLKG